MKNFASKGGKFHVNSATCVSRDRLEDLFSRYGQEIDARGQATPGAVAAVFSGCALVGSPTIRDATLAYLKEQTGRSYTRARANQFLAGANFFVWRDGIRATQPVSLHVHLNACIETARRGKVGRTGTDPSSGAAW